MPYAPIKPWRFQNKKWLSSNAPLSPARWNIRDLPPKLWEARLRLIANPPATVSSTDIPSVIREVISKHLWKHNMYHNDPTKDPRRYHHGQPIEKDVVPERQYDAEGNEIVEVPNPFLTQRYPISNNHPMHSNSIQHRFKRMINPSAQRGLRAQWPPYSLPPSDLNPMENPPTIIWNEKEWTGTRIKWTGEWEEKKPKGLYSNRAKLFKGRKSERTRDERMAEVAERMETMDERIAKWREQKRKEKIAARPQLPW